MFWRTFGARFNSKVIKHHKNCIKLQRNTTRFFCGFKHFSKLISSTNSISGFICLLWANQA